ncbi:MAG: hypothetical protein EBU32_12580 [Opitutaceae bacterium]|nr:hypothetical protein [Opitutaceae bacterium]
MIGGERRGGVAQALAELVSGAALRSGLVEILIFIKGIVPDGGFNAGIDLSLGAGEELLEAFGVGAGVDALLAGGGHNVHHGGLAFDEQIFEFLELGRGEVQVPEERGVAGVELSFLLGSEEALDLGLLHGGHEVATASAGATRPAVAAITAVGVVGV